MAKNDDYIDYLSRVPLFSALGKKELKQISSLTYDMNAEPGKEIVREGTPGHEFYIVTEGEAVATLRGKELGRYGPGDFFGEMALVDQGPRSASVTAKTKVSLLVLGDREFAGLMDSVAPVARKILKGVAARLRAYQESSAA